MDLTIKEITYLFEGLLGVALLDGDDVVHPLPLLIPLLPLILGHVARNLYRKSENLK